MREADLPRFECEYLSAAGLSSGEPYAVVNGAVCMSIRRSNASLVLSGLLCLVFHALQVEAAEVVLSFPMESVGVVVVSNPPDRDGRHLTFDLNVRDVRQAQGRVPITDDGFIGLDYRK